MKKIKARLVCLIVAGVMLAGAITVAAIEGSPYETLKNAVFNSLTNENFTVKGEMTMTVNGEIYEQEFVHYVHTETGSVDLARTRGIFNDNFHFSTDTLEIYPVYRSSGGEQWYAARTARTSSSRAGGLVPAEELDSARFRFMELLVDFFIGDLKNNMYLSSNDGIRRVSGAISHNQLPEIVRAGIYMVIEESQRWYNGDFGSRDGFGHPMNVPIQSLVFNRISGDADIDAAGNLLYLNAYANITTVDVFGYSNVIEVSAIFNFTDIGTSEVESPVYGAVELFTPEFMYEEFGRRYGIVYFMRNADGSIDQESITTAWPSGRSGR